MNADIYITGKHLYVEALHTYILCWFSPILQDSENA